jgi:hypothetical protein
MKSLILFLILGVAVLFSMKVAATLLAVVLPLVLISLIMAVPVALVVGLGWGAVTFLRGLGRGSGTSRGMA